MKSSGSNVRSGGARGRLVNRSQASSVIAVADAAIITLGRTLVLRVVVQGVETAGQQAFLGHFGCDTCRAFT
ncbi:hypothetical protein AWB76_05206 [Caballeronia temeraria]|uniref:EAL domain-containing protein n=1 Tax=Caballeronia temeraria TaxID=1777137 RepID=A0A158C7D5_9BURK|nr:hypothetical protein AWB76_05206 [Caballeronia temeraria]